MDSTTKPGLYVGQLQSIVVMICGCFTISLVVTLDGPRIKVCERWEESQKVMTDKASSFKELHRSHILSAANFLQCTINLHS